MADLDDLAVVIAEDLNGIDARVTAVEATVDKIKLANSSTGSGPPTGTAPVGWYYTDVITGDVYRMEA